MNPELVKFHLPTTDQFSVAVDNQGGCDEYDAIRGDSASAK
jgi:hypothetical protein